MSTDAEIIDWLESKRPLITKTRESECSGDIIEVDTGADVLYSAKTLRGAVSKAIKADAKRLAERGVAL